MTTVACVWVAGHVPYSAEYVLRLQSMVKRWIDRPFRFVCLTDRPYLLANMATIRVARPVGLYGWWSKIQLFNPAHSLLSGRILYLDLDTLVIDSLAPVLDYEAAFALAPDTGSFMGKEGLSVVKKFNSSVMVWDEGATDRLFTKWTPDVAARLWGDQDYIGEQYPNAAAMPAEWFPRLSQCAEGPPAGAKVVLSKVPKNIEAAKRYPWVAEAWV